jgi:two-component system sensor histidine kinase VicK
MKSDLTEYKHKISELRTTLAWMDIVLSNIADSVCVIKEDGKILFINDSFAEMINRTRISLMGQDIQDTISLTPKSGSYTESFPLKDAISRGSDSTKGIYDWHLDEKSSITVKLIAHYINPTKQVVIMLQNITNEYEVEQISRNFTNLASHQLRTPLTAIQLHSNMLADGHMGKLKKEQREAAKVVLDATSHMNQLLNMLLDISKLDNKRYERRSEKVYINDILQRIFKEVNDQVVEKEINLKINMPSHTEPFVSDGHMLHEVFSNIITNAIKYSHNNGTVYVAVATDDGSCVVMIEDYGIGIPKQFQEKIYSQFFRANNAIDSEQPGTGLGLYLVKQLVELLGGEIDFKSAYKKGTTFWVTLPRSRVLEGAKG